VLPLAQKLNVALLRLAPSLACAVHPGLLATFFNSLLSDGRSHGFEIDTDGKSVEDVAAVIPRIQ
jgi:hypothetical protein